MFQVQARIEITFVSYSILTKLSIVYIDVVYTVFTYTYCHDVIVTY